MFRLRADVGRKSLAVSPARLTGPGRRVDEEAQELSVDIDGRPIVYDFSGLDEILLAYCLSIHTSQGSEYPAIVIPVLIQHYVMLQRNLLYTGVTRRKKLVVLVGTSKALRIAFRNKKSVSRHNVLADQLS